ncbi:hypothetical protein WA026_001205 [Henosepilachna vigintioctopunctata]|uniref:Chitin-binding type-2 domain-containing protein n=1 Tax=Henosepilachna vigintioctopunctata TaxID=420089 RepID=A0AAW1UPP5_9CUCU
MGRRHVFYNWTMLRVILILSVIFFKRTLAGRQIDCIENGKFYRDPARPTHKVWTDTECAKYFLCLEKEVFHFHCSTGLLFDVNRQICDFKANVVNCDVTSVNIPRPLLQRANCKEFNQLGCADGTCLPQEYFCDGSVDCGDGSDEGHCDGRNDPNSAFSCNTAPCKLPDCFCSKTGTDIPSGLNAKEVPQMIVVTFDDAVNSENWDIYTRELFTSDRTNPNGCPLKATFFVSHQYNNYQMIQKLWNLGHEIAVHSVTHRGPEQWWSQNATIEDWFDEMVGEANILHRFSKIKLDQIRGVRAPFLKVGWNRQFLMMKEFGFEYDSSIIAPVSNPPYWPYTMDFKMPHKCSANQNCPTRSYPGLWEMVINPLEAQQYSCPLVDSCPSHLSGDDIYSILMHNFKRHYHTNRAPFGLYFHATWFKKKDYLLAFQKFLDNVLKRPDVWFVTNKQAIQWIKNPTPINRLFYFEEWGCNKRYLKKTEIACSVPNECKVYSRVFQQNRILHTCTECPLKYPWLRNEFGTD